MDIVTKDLTGYVTLDVASRLTELGIFELRQLAEQKSVMAYDLGQPVGWVIRLPDLIEWLDRRKE